jgi:hypothetical protein
MLIPALSHIGLPASNGSYAAPASPPADPAAPESGPSPDALDSGFHSVRTHAKRHESGFQARAVGPSPVSKSGIAFYVQERGIYIE